MREIISPNLPNLHALRFTFYVSRLYFARKSSIR